MSEARRRAPRRPARQLCLICTIVDGLAARAEQDLEEGRVEAVREALRHLRAQISGYRDGVPAETLRVPVPAPMGKPGLFGGANPGAMKGGPWGENPSRNPG